MGLRTMHTDFSFSVGSASIRDPQAPRTIPCFSLSLQSNVPATNPKRKYSSRQRQGHVFPCSQLVIIILVLMWKEERRERQGRILFLSVPFINKTLIHPSSAFCQKNCHRVAHLFVSVKYHRDYFILRIINITLQASSDLKSFVCLCSTSQEKMSHSLCIFLLSTQK